MSLTSGGIPARHGGASAPTVQRPSIQATAERDFLLKQGSHLWQPAASTAARFHANQILEHEKTPYMSHPFRVAMTVRDVFGVCDPIALAAALLHVQVAKGIANPASRAEGNGRRIINAPSLALSAVVGQSANDGVLRIRLAIVDAMRSITAEPVLR